MPKANPNLIGQRFGQLVVTAAAERPPRRRGMYWTCACDCGRAIVASTSHLQTRHTRSCGWHRAGASQQAGITSLMHRYKNGARQRGIAFALTREQFVAATSSPCNYCGVAASAIRYGDLRCAADTIAASAYPHNGLDRVDSAKGYTVENVVPCCKFCNNAKWSMTVDDFKVWVASVYKHMKLG